MNTEISGVILQWTLLVTLCYPLGRYIAKVEVAGPSPVFRSR